MIPDVELSIKFDNPEEMFISGEPVTGFVTCKVNRRLKVSVLKVVFLGQYILFQSKAGGKVFKEIVNETAKLSMAGKVSDIPVGIYDSPFNFMLEPVYPSSVACLAGFVVYKLAARCGYKVSEDSDVVTLAAVSYISVSRKLHLSDCPFALVPNSVRRNFRPGGYCSTLLFLFCGNELQVALELPRSAYVCGDRITLSVIINNSTSHVINESKIELLQILKSAYTKHKVSVVRLHRGMVPKNSSRVWMNENLLVPSLPPSCDDPILRISYQVRVSLKRDDGKFINVPMSIIIGNVPIDDSIIESRGKELSFSLRRDEGSGDAGFIPSYLVYRFAERAVAAPPAPEIEDDSQFHDVNLSRESQ